MGSQWRGREVVFASAVHTWANPTAVPGSAVAGPFLYLSGLRNESMSRGWNLAWEGLSVKVCGVW